MRENIPSKDVWQHLGEGKGGLDFIEPFAVWFMASVSVQGGGMWERAPTGLDKDHD